jgi:hypothetical protein
LDAEFRWSFTATIIYNSLEDISGFLAFHQRVEWAADNGATDERLMEFVNGLFEQSGVSNDDAMSISPNDGEMSPDNVTDNNDVMSVALNDAEMSPDNVAGFVMELEHLDDRSDSHTLEDDIDMGDPDCLSDDDAESWVERCLSKPDLSVSERMDKINGGWLCTHFPALLALNSGRPASINEKKRGKVNKKPIAKPFVTNPYDLYHAINPNSPRCATTAAFDYWVKPYLPNRQSEGNEKKIEWRIGCILRQLVICRNTSSVIFCRSGEVQCGKTLPPMTIWTQDLRLKPDEQADYDAKEGTCSIDMLVNLTQTHLTPDEEQSVSKAHGRFRRVSLLTTHLGTWALRKSNTKDLQKWEKNDFNLIYLLHLMRKGQGTLPESIRSVPADTPRRILEQFLWGSPKFRRMLTKVDEVCIKNGDKLLLWFNRPLSVILADRVCQPITIPLLFFSLA